MNQPRKQASHLDVEEQNLLQQVMDRRRKELEIRGGGPGQISHAIREVIAQRKIGRAMESRELSQLWRQCVAEDLQDKTRVVSLRNRILLVEVSDSVLMSEMASFHQRTILRSIQKARPDLNIKSLRFKLNPGLKRQEK